MRVEVLAHRGKWLVMGVLALAALSAVLAVNTFPVVTDDSLVYLDHSRALGREGWVTEGFRQAGYPFFLFTTRGVARAVGVEPLLTAAVIQRLLLVAAAVLAWVIWRWWAIPLVVFLLSARTLAYTNFLLNEGLAVPLAALLALTAIYGLRSTDSIEGRPGRSRLVAMVALAAMIALFLASMRFTFVVFGVVPAALLIAGWRSGARSWLLGVFGAYLLGLAAMMLLMSLENARDYDIFAPSVGGNATAYYYAWMQVFRVDPGNQDDPDLARFYDDGQPRHFIEEVNAADLEFEERIEAYEVEIEAMFRAAGMSKPEAQVRSMFFGLAGGRVDDVRAAVDLVTAATRETIDSVSHLNRYVRRNGAEAFEARFNEGQAVDAVVTDPVGRPLPLPRSRRILQALLPLSLVVMGVGAWQSRTRIASLIGLVVMAGTVAGLGLIWADNFRFLMPASVLALVMGTHVASTFGDSAARP